jgi:beta-galactosidase GanA
MVQVENETGTYGSVRDYSAMAERAFREPVPAALLTALGRSTVKGMAWGQAFGPDADEFFHAWSTAQFVNAVADAGKAEYALPMYVNAALRDPINPQDPLTYSSGGPTHYVLDVWKAGARSIDLIAPDIYLTRSDLCMAGLHHYARSDNVLFVPEIGNKRLFVRYMYSVLGLHAIGYSPFGIDFTGFSNYPLGPHAVGAEMIERFAVNYRVLAPMAWVWAQLAFESDTWGASEADSRVPEQLDLGHWRATVEFNRWQFGAANRASDERPVNPLGPDGGALIARLGPNEYLVIGHDARITFTSAEQKGVHGTLFNRVEEGHYDDHGQWIFERLWNGDQIDFGLNFSSAPQILHVSLSTY